MLFFVCTSKSCGFVMRTCETTHKEADILIGQDSEWYPDKYVCPMCGSVSKCSVEYSGATPARDLTPKEIFAALVGAGLPEEQECSATVIKQILIGSTVVDANICHIPGTGRCLLNMLTLSSGYVVFIGSSAHGACVYRAIKGT